MVFVLDHRKQPLMPCSEKRARLLLARKRAVVARLHPFTIRLKDRRVEHSVIQPVRLKLDPGSRHTGVALVREDSQDKATVLHLAQIDHRTDIHKRMLQRASSRRRRRSANLRYRAARFHNRRRPEGWLAPSLRARVDNVVSWVRRYRMIAPVGALSVELAKFDTQALENPEIKGVEYQQGTLAGYEVREYLLEKFGHRCAYCEGLSGDPILNVEHIIPKGMNGSDRIANLALACATCNDAKGNRTPEMWAVMLAASRKTIDQVRAGNCATVQARAKVPLPDVAAVNATRWAIYRALKATCLPVETGTGGRTKWNRMRLGLPKSHTLDALSVGVLRACWIAGTGSPVLFIRCVGRGQRQRTNVDASGFPRGYLPRQKSFYGFRTGDAARAEVPPGRKTSGVHVGRVRVRKSGSFRVGAVDGVSYRYCRLLARGDGYEYVERRQEHSSPD